MSGNSVKILMGVPKVEQNVRQPFDQKVIRFLDRISQEIKSDPVLGKKEEIMAFGFWCRKSHLKMLKEQAGTSANCLGRGILFHIAPSNVPILFAYSFAFGLLAGNSNVIRVSSKAEDEMSPVCRLMDRVLTEQEFEKLRNQNSVVAYERQKELTDMYSKNCSMRIIWGGDEAIREIRKSPIPPEAEELVFSDRVSIALLDAGYLSKCSQEELGLWAHRFYNDTYGVDQNACSSPRIIFWLKNSKHPDQCKAAKRRWWEKVHETAQRYHLTDHKVSMKYTQLCEYAASKEEVADVWYKDHLLYVARFGKLPHRIDTFRGSCGFFFEFDLEELSQLVPVLDRKIQTLTYLGVDPDVLVNMVIQYQVQGIDRIVPVGQALDMGIIWDGKNLISQMSRQISLN